VIALNKKHVREVIACLAIQFQSPEGSMPYHFHRAALTAFAALAFTAFAPLVSSSALAQKFGTGAGAPTPNATNLNSSRSNIYRTGTTSGTKQGARATTVKSSKSNTSDRMGGGGGKGAARATTVKSSKSNTSD
jgi:hypothetical protein